MIVQASARSVVTLNARSLVQVSLACFGVVVVARAQATVLAGAARLLYIQAAMTGQLPVQLSQWLPWIKFVLVRGRFERASMPLQD